MIPTPPMVSPRFRYNAGWLEYKPFPSYPTWLQAWEVGTISTDTLQDQIDAINLVIEDLSGADNLIQDQIDALVIDVAAAQAAAEAAAAEAASIEPLQQRVTMWHDECHSLPAVTLAINPVYMHNFVAFSTAQFFQSYHSFVCGDMPSCKLIFVGTKANNQGIMHVYLDGNSLGTYDMYSSTTLNNQLIVISIVSGAITAGRHTIRINVDTKNGSSSGYALVLTKYYLLPDTDTES